MKDWAYVAAVSTPMCRTKFTMLSTADWSGEVSSEFQTGTYGSDVTPASSEWTTVTPTSFVPYSAALAFIGYLGTVTNGLVLAGFWLSDRSKMTSSSIHIVNHTTLELSTRFVF